MELKEILFIAAVSVAAFAAFVAFWCLAQTRWRRFWRTKNAAMRKERQAHSTCQNIAGRLANAAAKVIANHPGAKDLFSVWSGREGMVWSMRIGKDVSAGRLPKVGGQKDPALPVLHVSMVPGNLAKARFNVWDNSLELRPVVDGELDLSTEEAIVQFLNSLKEHIANLVAQRA